MALIPSERLTDWTPGTYTGVPGGIAQYLPGGANQRLTASFQNVTEAPYNADPTGVNNSLSAIQDAITDFGSVYIPAGTYLCNGVITIPAGYDNHTIRGDGIGQTILTGLSIRFGTEDSGFNIGATHTLVTNSPVKGGTSIEVADASFISVGQLIMISWDDETDNAQITAGATPICSVGGHIAEYGNRRQVTRVTAKVSNTLTIFPGIYHVPADTPAYVRAAGLQIESFGIEDLTIDTPGTTFPIYFVHGYGCWTLNVGVVELTNYGIAFGESLQCEIRRCDIREGVDAIPSQGGLLFGTCAGMLVEDNILVNVFPLIEINSGTCGSVFSYNVCESLVGGSIQLAIDTNHNPHNSHNLFEGNVTPNVMSDGYFGSDSEGTIYRNWLHGSSLSGGQCFYSVALKRFTRNFSIVGNVCGKTGVAIGTFSYGGPNIGNGDSDGTAEPSTGSFWRDWKATGTLTTRTSDTAGTITLDSPCRAVNGQYVSFGWSGGGYQNITVSSVAGAGSIISWTDGGPTALPAQGTAVTMAMQAGGFQEIDLDVENTVIDKGNYSYGTNGAAGSMTGLGGDTLIDSLYTTKAEMEERGVVWGGLFFPPFDPTEPGEAGYADIPAGYRYLNNGNDPAAGTGVTITVANVTNFNIL